MVQSNSAYQYKSCTLLTDIWWSVAWASRVWNVSWRPNYQLWANHFICNGVRATNVNLSTFWHEIPSKKTGVKTFAWTWNFLLTFMQCHFQHHSQPRKYADLLCHFWIKVWTPSSFSRLLFKWLIRTRRCECWPFTPPSGVTKQLQTLFQCGRWHSSALISNFMWHLNLSCNHDFDLSSWLSIIFWIHLKILVIIFRVLSVIRDVPRPCDTSRSLRSFDQGFLLASLLQAQRRLCLWSIYL